MNRDEIERRNNVHIQGTGRPMLFAHGFGCDQEMWRLVAPEFAATHRTVLFDYVGSGRSDRHAYDPMRYASLEGYARDVLDICEAFELNDAVLVGHSVSSMVGMLAAIEQPQRFAQLVMIGPSPCYINEPGYHGGFERSDLDSLLQLMESNGMSWASYLAPVVMQNPDRPELVSELQHSFCSNDPTILRQFAEATFLSDYRAHVSLCRTPTLLMQCQNDHVAPLEVGAYLHRHLARSTLHQLAATGHCPHVSHPAEIIAVMRAHLQD